MTQGQPIARKAALLVALLVVSAFLFLYGNGAVALTDPDEPVYSETAREMFVHNDFTSPRIYNEFWYDKPVMFYWLTALSQKMFGVSEFAARFPSAMMGLLGVFAIYTAGRKLFGFRAGILGGFVLATSVEYWYLAKAGVTDMTLTFFLTMSLLGFYFRKYYLFWLFAGLATLTKGPIGVFFPVVISAAYIFVHKEWYRLKELKWFSGIILLLAVAAPWYIVMYSLHGMDFVNTFLGFHNVTRFTQPEHPEGRLLWYFIPVFIVGFFPWIGFAPQILVGALSKHLDEWQKRPVVFFLLWAVIVFGFFTISQTKLISYILPMYPAVALLAGWWLDLRLKEENAATILIGLFLSTVVGLGLSFALYWGVKNDFVHLLTAAVPLALGIVVMLLTAWLFAAQRDYRKIPVALIAVSVVFVFFLMKNLFPMAQDYVSVRNIARDYNSLADKKLPVAVVKFDRPGFMFYTHNPGLVVTSRDGVTEIAEIVEIVKQNNQVYLLMDPKKFEQLPVEVRNRCAIIAQRVNRILFLYDVSKVPKGT